MTLADSALPPPRPAGLRRPALEFVGRGVRVLLWGVVAVFLQPQVMAQTAPTAPVAKSTPGKPVNGNAGAKSGWIELTPSQQAALQPLAPTWGSMSEAQKRKWIALSQNFHHLAPAERATLHGRMTEWVNLSPVQRSQARLNFAQTNRLSTDEKRAQWQAYQALSPEQKQQLAAGGQVLPSGAAPALKPVESHKLATVPVTRSNTTTPSRPVAGKQRPASAPRSARPASAPVERP